MSYNKVCRVCGKIHDHLPPAALLGPQWDDEGTLVGMMFNCDGGHMPSGEACQTTLLWEGP